MEQERARGVSLAITALRTCRIEALLYQTSVVINMMPRLLPRIPSSPADPSCKTHHLQRLLFHNSNIQITTLRREFTIIIDCQRGLKPQARQPLPANRPDPRPFNSVLPPRQVIHLPIIRRPSHMRLFFHSRFRCRRTRCGKCLAVFRGFVRIA